MGTLLANRTWVPARLRVASHAFMMPPVRIHSGATDNHANWELRNVFGKFRQIMISIGAKMLIAVLVLSFAIWGVGDHLSFTGDGNTSTVATVGDSEIGRQDYLNEVQRQVARFRRALGANVTDEQILAMGVPRRVLEGMIQRTVFGEGARKMGLIISEDALATEVRRDERFLDAGGQFNRSQFNRVLYDNGYQEGKFLNLLKADLIRAQLLSGIVNGQTAPKSLANALHGYRMERRIADLVSLPNRNLTNVPNPTDTEIERYHKDNAPQFTAPEYRDFSLVRLQTKDVLDEVEISEESIRSAYVQRLNEFTEPERRTIRQILLPSKEQARKAKKALISGANFGKVAADFAKMAPEATQLGEFSQGQMPVPALDDAAFELSSGGVSEPIKSALGWHILKVTKIKELKEQSFEEVRGQIRKELAADKAVDVLFKLANNFEDILGGGATLGEAAKRLNFKLERFTKLDSAGAGGFGAPVSELDPEVLRVAFETEENNDSPLIDAGENGYFILHTEKVTPPTLRPLDNVRSQVRNAMFRDRRAVAAANRADALAKEVMAGTSLAKLAKKFGGTTWTSKAFTRAGDGLERRLPRAVIAQIFEARRGQASAAGAGENQVIAVLKHIESANPLADKEGAEQILVQLNQGIGSDLTTQFAAALRAKYGVSVNQAALKSPLIGDGGLGRRPVAPRGGPGG